MSSSESSTINTRRGVLIQSLWRGRRLVQNQPVQTELSDSIGELTEIDGLAHVAVGAQAVTMDPVLLFVRGCQNDDREETRKLICSSCRRTSKPSTFGNFKSSRVT